jgi:hypothetical protein
MSKVYMIYIFVKKKCFKKKKHSTFKKNTKNQKQSNVRNSRPHQDFKLKKKKDEFKTKSNQTEPYPSTLSSLIKKKKGVHTPSVSLFVQERGD